MSRSEKFVICAVVFAVVASAALYGVWEDKFVLFAPLVVLLYLALAVWLGSVGLFKKNADLRSRSALQIPPGGIPLFLFWLYSAVLIPFSVIPYEATISTLRFGCYLGVYWAAANILSRFPRRKGVLLTVFISLLAIALYSLVQHKVDPEMLFGHMRYADYGERLGGTYICPNHIAHLFQMWIPLCLVCLFIPRFGWFWRICFGYATAVFLLLIYQTQSRAGLLGTVAAIGMTVLLLMMRKSRRLFMISLLVVPLLGAGVVGGLWAGSSMFRNRMQPVVRVLKSAREGDWERVASLDFRPMTWADASELIADHPWIGVGPGNYRLTFPEYRERWRGVRRETGHPHSEPIELLAEYGAVGAVLFLWALGCVWVPLLRFVNVSKYSYHALPAIALLAALTGTFVHGLFDFELRIFPNALMLALLAGSAVAPMLKTEDGRRRTDDRGEKDKDGRRRREDVGERSERIPGRRGEFSQPLRWRGSEEQPRGERFL